MPRLMMSLPLAASAVARARTAKAFSSPMRSKAEMVWSISALQIQGCRDVGSSKIATGKQQRQIAITGGSIDETIAEVQPGWMSAALAVASRCYRCDLGFGKRQSNKLIGRFTDK